MEKHNLRYGFKYFANVCEVMYNIDSLFQEILQPKAKIERYIVMVYTHLPNIFFAILHISSASMFIHLRHRISEAESSIA
jgi:hypothetical protein